MNRHYGGASMMWLMFLLGLAIGGAPLLYVLLLFFPVGFLAVGLISAVWDWTDRH